MMMEVPQCVEVSYEDAQCLMKIAQSEAGNQSIDGMALVMKCVLNRVADEDYPDTVYDVISQKLGDTYMFQSYANGSYDKAIPCVNCHLALAEIEMGMFEDDTIIAFEITGVRSLDKYFMYAFTMGGHDFYTEK